MTNMQQASQEELLKQGASTEGQAPTTVSEDQYKSLQSEFTKTRQAQIDLAIKLAGANKKAILELDADLQSKVIKKIYGLDNLEELTSVYGENFYEETDEGKEDNGNDEKISKMEKEYKILKWNLEKKEIDEAINAFKNENKILSGIENLEEKLKEELKYISSELPIKERINRAGRAAFGAISSTDAIYAKIMETSSSNNTTATTEKPKAKEDTSMADAVLAKLKINKKI